jgi:hypothetical protein
MKTKKLIEELKALPKPRKTYLEILKVHQKEVPMANLLAYFFDPNKDHGLGELFIRSLLKTNYYELNEKKYSRENLLQDIDESPFKGVKVSTEVSTEVSSDKENNESTDTSKYIDILIETEKLVICIEFKIKHKLNNPLEAYYNFIERNEIKNGKKDSKNYNKTKLYVVLTPIWKQPEGDAITENTAFKQILLSHFIETVTDGFTAGDAEAADTNLYTHYYTDLIQTIHNRATEYNVGKILASHNYYLDSPPIIKPKDDLGRFWINKVNEYKLKELRELKKLMRTSSYHSNDKGGFIQLKKENHNIKIRIEEDKWRVEEWSKDNKPSGKIKENNSETFFENIDQLLKNF